MTKVRRLYGPSPPPPAPGQIPSSGIKRKREQSPPPVVVPRYAAHIDIRAHTTLDKVHSTHHMATHRGLAWCQRCGCMIQFLARRIPALKDLSKPCKPPTSTGQRTLKEMLREPPKLPNGLKEWPEDAYRANQVRAESSTLKR